MKLVCAKELVVSIWKVWDNFEWQSTINLPFKEPTNSMCMPSINNQLRPGESSTAVLLSTTPRTCAMVQLYVDEYQPSTIINHHQSSAASAHQQHQHISHQIYKTNSFDRKTKIFPSNFILKTAFGHSLFLNLSFAPKPTECIQRHPAPTTSSAIRCQSYQTSDSHSRTHALTLTHTQTHHSHQHRSI
jgi:hypothetical protein